MYTRQHPYISRIKERVLLTKGGSSKKTYHLVLDIENSGLTFKVGDSIGVVPTNDAQFVDQILNKLGYKDTSIEDPRLKITCTLREFLLHRANINKVSFHKIFNVEKTALPLLELIEYYKPSPDELCRALLPLLPRFYSIASSAKVFPNEIHLTVAFVSFKLNNHTYFGVGSHFLCEQALIESTPIPIYIQPSNHFTLPQDPNTPIILIGPGTGIAPFRAFLQERIATQAKGRNWLFFGERNRETDFYYSEYFSELEKQGRLRLDVAFSRDQDEKIYVQHKILENKKSIWHWLQEGAYIYVCGNGEKMGKDVDLTLQEIVQNEGKFNADQAKAYIKNLRLEKRYLLDVY